MTSIFLCFNLKIAGILVGNYQPPLHIYDYHVPEAAVTASIAADLEAQQVSLEELHIDRAYLTSHWVKERDPNLKIICKAWRVRNGQRFDKRSFVLDWENHVIRCPNGVSLPFSEGKVIQFPQQECNVCPLRSQCTTSSKGRTVSIHPDESLLQELHERQSTPAGRARLRERVTVEHSLAHIGQWLSRSRSLFWNSEESF